MNSRLVQNVVILVAVLMTCSLVEAKEKLSGDSVAGQKVYAKHCAQCHGGDRLGGQGPALIPEVLKRLKPKKAAVAIREGLPASQMPAYKSLTDKQIDDLVALIFSKAPSNITWGLKDVEKSRVVYNDVSKLPNKPIFKSDPLDIFMVVEAGDHFARVLQTKDFKTLKRFKTRYAVHGGVKYSPDGRFAWLVSRDGWVTSFDVYNLKKIAEVRAGINARNIAVSGDGKYVAVANYLPQTLIILDSMTLKPLKLIDVKSADGVASRVSAVYAAPPRESFIVALKDVPEVWELSCREDSVKPHTGLVHDFRKESGEPIPKIKERFPIRRIKLEGILDDFFFSDGFDNLVGSSRGGAAWVVNLIVGRPIKKLDLGGLPHLGSGITWTRNGSRVMATQNMRDGLISVIDTEKWEVIAKIKTKGPGFFLRSHENSRYVWADVFFGPHKDLVHVIDKQTLKIVKTLRPFPGKLSGHVEFNRNGKYALLSIHEADGAIVVYDAAKLVPIKTIPMAKPSGKYNVFNKINHSEGTSR